MKKPYTHITRDGKFEARIIEYSDSQSDAFPIKVVLKAKNASEYHTYYTRSLKFHLDQTRSVMDLIPIEQYRRKKAKLGLIGFAISAVITLYLIILLIANENGDYTKAFNLEYVAGFYVVIIATAIVIITAITSIYYLILKPKVKR